MIPDIRASKIWLRGRLSLGVGFALYVHVILTLQQLFCLLLAEAKSIRLILLVAVLGFNELGDGNIATKVHHFTAWVKISKEKDEKEEEEKEEEDDEEENSPRTGAWLN